MNKAIYHLTLDKYPEKAHNGVHGNLLNDIHVSQAHRLVYHRYTWMSGAAHTDEPSVQWIAFKNVQMFKSSFRSVGGTCGRVGVVTLVDMVVGGLGGRVFSGVPWCSRFSRKGFFWPRRIAQGSNVRGDSEAQVRRRQGTRLSPQPHLDPRGSSALGIINRSHLWAQRGRAASPRRKGAEPNTRRCLKR